MRNRGGRQRVLSKIVIYHIHFLVFEDVKTPLFKTRGEVSGRDTRLNTKQLDVPLYRSTAGQRTFHYRTVTLWNNINPDLRLLHMMNVRFSLLNMAQRILGVTLPNF